MCAQASISQLVIRVSCSDLRLRSYSIMIGSGESTGESTGESMSRVVGLGVGLGALVSRVSRYVSRYVMARCAPSAASSAEDANVLYERMEQGLLIPYQLFPRVKYK